MGARTGELLLAAGAITTGIAGAVLVVVARRSLGLHRFLPIASLWSIWALCAAVMNFAFQQTIIQIEATSSHEIKQVLRGKPAVALMAATLSTLVVTRVAGVRIFASDDWWWPILAAAIVPLSTLLAITRGVLASARRFGLLGLAIGGENVIRLAIVLVIVATTGSQRLIGLALLLGYVVIPLALPTLRQPKGASTVEETGQLLGATVAIGLGSHSIFVVSPLVLAVAGVDAELVAVVFLLLTAARIPHVGLQALMPRAAVAFGDWVRNGDLGSLQRSRRALSFAVVAVAGVSCALGAVLGEPTLGAVLSVAEQTRPLDYGFAAAAAVLAFGATLLSSLAVALGNQRVAAVCWAIVALALAAALALVAPSSPSTTLGLIVAAELTVVVGLTIATAGIGDRLEAMSRRSVVGSAPNL